MTELHTLDLLYFDFGVENEEGDARPIFIPNACHICKAMKSSSGPDEGTSVATKLLSCSGCRYIYRLWISTKDSFSIPLFSYRLIAYCGPQHQKDHWPQHRVLYNKMQIFTPAQLNKRKIYILSSNRICANPCSRYWKTTIERASLSASKNWIWRMKAGKLSGTISWSAWREHSAYVQAYWNRSNILEKKKYPRFDYYMQRPMQPYEREMFLYPRVCATCRTDEGNLLKSCPDCLSLFYCCDQHIPPDHSSHCRDLKLLLDINVEQSKKGRIDCMLPHELIKDFQEFPPSLKVYIYKITKSFLNLFCWQNWKPHGSIINTVR